MQRVIVSDQAVAVLLIHALGALFHLGLPLEARKHSVLQNYLHGYLEVVVDLHGRPHDQVLLPVGLLCLADHVELLLVV